MAAHLISTPGATVQRRRAVLVAPASDDRKARKALASIADEVVLDLWQSYLEAP